MGPAEWQAGRGEELCVSSARPYADAPMPTMVLEDIQPLCHGTRDILTDILVC